MTTSWWAISSLSPRTMPPMVVPGEFTVSFAKRVDRVDTAFGQAQKFTVYPLGSSPLMAKDRAALGAFQREVADLQRVALGTARYVAFLNERVSTLQRAFDAVQAERDQIGPLTRVGDLGVRPARELER